MWDVFCRVIDNHGDLGVCVRLARQLAARGESVRLWVDDASALAWMAPDLAQGRLHGVQCLPWAQASDPAVLSSLAPLSAESAWIEAFGCELPEAFVAHGVAQVTQRGLSPPAWINLEYLSAEPWAERTHGLPSPVMSGPAQGWVKRFFYPGFTPGTGGLLREPDLPAQQSGFDRDAHRQHLLTRSRAGADPDSHRLAPATAGAPGRLISLFCYEPAGLPDLLNHWTAGDHLLVTPGRALAAVKTAMQGAMPDPTAQSGGAELPAFAHPLPHTDQAGFDRLLWACDLNLVRGEDSLVRALWAGQPLVWQIYPQDEDAHHAKLAAFLDWLDAPASLRRFHGVWNGIEPGPLPALSPTTLNEWSGCIQAARQGLLAQTDLLTQLLDMARAGPQNR